MSWQEILKNNYKSAKDLASILNLSTEEQKYMDRILQHYPMSIPPYYLSLIDFSNKEDPIRKMCIPSISETDLSGSFDTSGEYDNTVMEGMQHKYHETAMILSTNHCAMYCRHCFRKRLVGLSDNEIIKHIDDMIDYIKLHTEISNVLISGGDSFLNTNETIERYLKGLSLIKHLDFIRFGTRTPVVFPQRITQDKQLQAILKKYNKQKQIYVVVQYNHPKEFTKESLEAISILLELGIVVRNQTVLLKGVNDHPDILSDLLKGLTANGILPYYIFQCRPVTGVKNQFQVPLLQGFEIVEKAKAKQNGQGKCFRYALSHKTGKIELIGLLSSNQMLFKYHQAKSDCDQNRIFTLTLPPEKCWLDNDEIPPCL